MGKDLQRSERNWDGSVNWDAVPHQQLWDWFSQPRLASMQGSAAAWTQSVAEHFQAAADEVNQALRTAGVHWEGQAAQSMQDASTPLAEHALVAKDAAIRAGHTTIRQLIAAQEVAVTVPEPKPVPTQQELLAASGGELAIMLTDAAQHEGAAREAEERARDLARTYDSGADDDVAALPRFEMAPAATVDKAEPGVIDSESFEPRRGDTGDIGGPGGPGDGRNADAGGPGATGGPIAPRPGDPSGGGTSGQSWTPPAANQPGTPSSGPGPSGPVDTPRSTTPAPVGLVPGGQTSGGPRGSAGSPGRGGGPAPGPGTGGRGGGPAPGPGAGVRGAVPGAGPVSGRAGGPATAGRGAGGMGMAPMGAGRGKGDDDTERTSPEYLRAHNDEFWDDTPALAPPVIGEDDDE